MGATVLQFASMARDIEAAQAAETKRASSARNVAVQAPSAINVPSLAQAKEFIVAARACRDFASKNTMFAAQAATYWRCFPGCNNKAAPAAWLDAACREAQRIVRCATTLADKAVPYTRSSLPSATGYVAGMPDPTGREIESLRAQCRALVSDIARASYARASTKDAERLLRVARARLTELGASE